MQYFTNCLKKLSILCVKLSKEVVYSVCTFDYYYNTTVTPSVLDGGTHILLANMLSPKRLVCSQDLHMAHPVPSYPYVLVNRSLLCNCHLESGLTYLLESLGSCSPQPKFIMYFTINSAFNHYMSLFGLSENETVSTELIRHDHIFYIFTEQFLSSHTAGQFITVPGTLESSYYTAKIISNNEFEVQGLPKFAFFPFGEAYQ